MMHEHYYPVIGLVISFLEPSQLPREYASLSHWHPILNQMAVYCMLTDAIHKLSVEALSEEGLWELSEVSLDESRHSMDFCLL